MSLLRDAELGILLPALPTPNRAQQRCEASGGCALVIAIVSICVGATSAVSMHLPVEQRVPLLVLILVEAGVALGCLGGLMFSDPGIIKRTPASALPIPAEVSAWLAEMESERSDSIAMSNVVHGDETYCVRCSARLRLAPPGSAPLN